MRGGSSSRSPKSCSKASATAWPYLIITRLHGVVGSDAWPTLPEDQKERVLAQIGVTIAEVQRAPLGELANIEPQWDRFISRQIEGCRARHERLGMPQKFLDGFDDILRDAATLIPLDKPPVILTGEYIPENFLLRQERTGMAPVGAV